jgi:hypothetical protein
MSLVFGYDPMEIWGFDGESSVLELAPGGASPTTTIYEPVYFKKVNPKSATVSVTSNLTANAWSTKCRRKKKLITQFSYKSRDKSFEPN